ncbi:MAG: PstS family phosphate ABC transporter substrate-binding protein [Candidatus Dadabacteria bacterium]|nr:MAG: PstS family phosphate ABC transporter substrate-binding protein [Candidatus Dadabacteria bacterium]
MRKIFLTAAAVALALTGPAWAGRKMVQVKGSDTLVNLAQSWAEAFLDETGQFVAVTGGGSGTGIAALIDGKADIADASRRIKPKEIELARKNGVEPVEFAVAVDGLCVIVNENNPIEALTPDDVGRLFRGEIKNWKALGGPDRPVTLYGRQSNSGTYVFFQEHVLGNKDYAATMNRMNGNAQILEAVARDASAIGYVGIGYVVDENGSVRKGIKPLKIKTADGEALSPLDREAVKAGRYPLARALYQYTNGTPKGVVAELLQFELSEAGQKIAEEQGFYPVGGELLEKNRKALGE